MPKRSQYIAAILFAALVPASAFADKVTDLYFQEVVERYFDYAQNARTFGMAGSSVMTSTDSSSVVGNPAGLGMMNGAEVSGTYRYDTISGHEFPTDQPVQQHSNSGSGMVAVPIMPNLNTRPEYGNFGFAWTEDHGTWHNDTFDTIAKKTQVSAAYAYALSDDLSLGYSLGWTNDKFQSREVFNYPMQDGFRHTFGVLWNAAPDLSIGSSAFVGYGEHNALYGPGITGYSHTLEEGMDVGAQQRVDQTLFSVSADYRHLSTDGSVTSSVPQNIVGGDENGNIFDARLGVEQTLDDNWKVRAGYRFAGLAAYNYERVELNPLNGSAYYSAVSLGAGYTYPLSSDYVRALKLDYGVEYRAIGHGDWEHVVTLSVPFDICEPS